MLRSRKKIVRIRIRFQESAVRFGRVDLASRRTSPGYPGYPGYPIYTQTPISRINRPRRPHLPEWERGVLGGGRGGGGGGGLLPELQIDERIALIDASNYPFSVNLRERISNIYGDSVINILSIEEYTPSLLRTDLEGILDEEGVLTYDPQGNYLLNALVIRFEAADAQRPPTIQARRTGGVYGSGSDPMFPVVSNPLQPADGTITVAIKDDIIGDPEILEQFWKHQGNNGTCLLEAVSASLRSLGLDDANFVNTLRRTTVRINAIGNIIDLDGNILSIEDIDADILIDGKPPYVYITEPLSPEYLAAVELLNPGISKLLKVGSIMPNPGLRQNWGWVETMFDAFDVDTHTGYATNFATLIEEIAAGNRVIAYVDAEELWRGDLIEFIDQNDWVPFAAARTAENHALWITGVEIDNGEAYIYVNDSGDREGRGRKYPLKKFAAAFEDSEFLYTATGPSAPDQAIQNQRKEIFDTIFTYVHPDGLQGSEMAERITQRLVENKFNRYISEERHLNAIEQVSPGFKAKVQAYKEAVNQQQTDVLTAIGLTEDEIAEIEKIFEEVDVE